MSNVLISVIMNCYNSETYLQEAIESVINQTHENWEIIFWDNQSTDNSAKIIKNYNDKRIKYFYSKTHSKLYESRNKAIAKCTGEYITFLDCDDIWLPYKLELQIDRFNDNIKIVYCNYDLINSVGEYIKSPFLKVHSGNITNKLFNNNFISIGSVMIRKELLKNNLFNPSYNLLGDLELWIRLSVKNNFIALNNRLEKSRVHENNTSKLLYDDWLNEKRRFYLEFFKKNNFIKYYGVIFYAIRTELRGLFENIFKING